MTYTRNPICGNFGKILPIQLPSEEDLITSLKKACADQGIRYGTILSTVGSVRKLTIEGVILTDHGPDFGPPTVVEGCLQVVSLEGFIYDSEEGETTQHIHGVFADTEGNIYGGHVIEGETIIDHRFVTVIAEITGLKMTERLHQDSGHLVMDVEPIK